MRLLTKKLKELFFSIIIFIPFISIYTLLIYKGVLNYDDNFIRLTSFLILILYFLLVGMIVGIIEKKKGLLNGVIVGTILIIFGIIFLRNDSFRFIQIIKYLTLLASTILGSIIGVNLAHFYFKKKVTKHYLKNKTVK